MTRLFQLLILFLIFSISSVNAAEDRALFWKVSSDTATVYLLGSIHFADKSFYPMRDDINAAFDGAASLVVELDITRTDSIAYNKYIQQHGVFKNGQTIKDVISEETWLQLRQRLKNMGIPYDSVKQYRPGILVLTLTAVQVGQLGFDAQLGIDMHYLIRAAKQDKNIIELETMEQQLQLLLNIPNSELLLKESLYSLDESALVMDDIVRYWKLGDDVKMKKLLFEDALKDYPAFSSVYDRIFFDRNEAMADKIASMLDAKDSYFIVVGSGHLVGDKGVVNLLREKGFDVERL